MPEIAPTSLQNFHHFVARQFENEETAAMSPEQALALWREEQETLAALREGLADIEAGRTRPFEEFDREFRAKHGL